MSMAPFLRLHATLDLLRRHGAVLRQACLIERQLIL